MYDKATRTFTATVDWGANNFGGDARWEYTMVFSDDFAFIAGGACRTQRAGAGQAAEPAAYDNDARTAAALAARLGCAGSQCGNAGKAEHVAP